MQLRHKRHKGWKSSFLLNATGIDNCSEMLEEQLRLRGVDSQNIIRIRFSFEESLLRMRDHFGEEEMFKLRFEDRYNGTQVQLEMHGEVYNPLSKTETEIEDWSGSLLTAVGISPFFSYSRGKNIIRIHLRRQSMNPAVKLFVTLAFGMLAGLALSAGLSGEALNSLAYNIFEPIFNMWVRMLNMLSGPIVFMMVLTSMMNSGSIEEEGGSQKNTIMRYLLVSMGAALLPVIMSSILFRSPMDYSSSFGKAMHDYFEGILSIIPNDVITPIMTFNTPQILLMACVLGSVLSVAGPRVGTLCTVIKQANMTGLVIMDTVCMVAPYFAAILLCMETIVKSLDSFWGMWGILLLTIIMSCLLILIVMKYVSERKQVPFNVLLHKVLPPFIMAIRTGSIDNGFGKMTDSCTRDLGIEKSFAAVSLPYGLILYMPVSAIGTLMFTIYIAVKDGLVLSIGWIVVAVVLSVALCVATPPVPGASLLSYIVIFQELGIPQEALIDAMIFDILFGIFSGAANQMLLQLDLILQADKIGLLKKDVLRKEEAN